MFKWILKPLPANLRIIVSLNEENCPDSWRFVIFKTYFKLFQVETFV